MLLSTFSTLLSFALAAVPFAGALTINTPQGLTSGGPANFTWTVQAGDPAVITMELINQAFNDAFGIANNVDPTLQQLTLTLPVVPVGDGYTLQFVNVTNITQVFASSGTFSIGATVSANSSSSTTGSGTATGTATITSNSTNSPTGTATGSNNTSTAPGSSTATSSSFSPTPSEFNNSGAMALSMARIDIIGFTVLVSAIFAGAKFLGL